MIEYTGVGITQQMKKNVLLIMMKYNCSAAVVDIFLLFIDIFPIQYKKRACIMVRRAAGASLYGLTMYVNNAVCPVNHNQRFLPSGVSLP